MDTKIGLIIQFGGVSLITLLTLFLYRSLKMTALKHWTKSWLFLSFAIFCLRLGFSYQEYSALLVGFHFLTEVLFGCFLVIGCRSLGENSNVPIPRNVLIVTFAFVALIVLFVPDDVISVFNLHALIMSGFFMAAFVELWRARIGSLGWKVMLAALALLTVNSLQYFAISIISQFVGPPAGYLALSSMIDLALQIMLGFGMVIVLLELVVADVKAANENLTKAHNKLKELAHFDPLTAALNRHAFHGYLKTHGGEAEPISGSVGFFDIDDLKTINDLHGHPAGDGVIRSVVGAIRDMIRPEDLIFRWGGDEFFVVVIGFNADMAEKRMAKLDQLLSNVQIRGVSQPLTIGVSYAFADFDDLSTARSRDRIGRRKNVPRKAASQASSRT